MMDYSTMTYEVKDNVGYVHFPRPEGANAVNPAFCSDLKNVMLEIESDDDVRSVAVTAEGKVFVQAVTLKNFMLLDRTSQRSWPPCLKISMTLFIK